MLHLVKNRTSVVAAAILACAAILPTAAAAADDYPNKPITWIAPSSPGGGFDVISRLLAPKLSEILGQSVVVQNIEGAGATIGASVAAEAAPDGYTILLANANHTVGMSLYKELKYDIVTSFDPIIRFAESYQIFIAHPKFEAQTMADVIAYAKANPGQLNAAHAGVGSPTHICLELLKMKTGVDITAIPYAGGGQALASIVSGETDMECAVYSAAKSFIEGGQATALAMTSKERPSFAPDIPTVAETVPDFEFLAWFGVLVPTGTPEAVRAKIGAAVEQAVADPAIREKMLALGMGPINENAEAFGAFLKSDVAQSKILVEKAGIEPK